ncbi:MAG: single-stranded DNA-binding protein [Brumimicrobium sp.]|nr:single-stranded DNA-binding protein [Brumimicrobium sp.]MCO5269783.1 single-stranded DNA-binding protein [Brumimicrobium sp.]
MATVFETRLIGNIGKDAVIRKMEKGVVAINFPVAHNKNWRDKKTGESRTKTTWVNCTIWKREGGNMRILDFLKSGTLVELVGTPYAKAFQREDGTIKTEIRLNISQTNVLRSSKIDTSGMDEEFETDEMGEDDFYSPLDDFSIDEDDF